MKFVSSTDKNNDKFAKSFDKLDVKEIKQPEEVKPKKAAPVKPIWKDAITTTLVNLRSNSSVNSKSIEQIKGGEILKINASKDFDGFSYVKYKNKEGFIKSEYLKEI